MKTADELRDRFNKWLSLLDEDHELQELAWSLLRAGKNTSTSINSEEVDKSKDEPVAWQSLTVEEINACKPLDGIMPLRDSFEVDELWMDNFAYAIDEALEEKNNPPTKTAPMKPMTEEEIDEEIATNEHYCERSFAEGVRFAEKHHGIGGSDE